MKTIIITLLILVFSITSSYAVKKIEANPINVAVLIVEKTDSLSIASDLDYYGYFFESSSNGKAEYRHPNGSIIRYRMSDPKSRHNYPIVEVISKTHTKNIDSILKDLRFKKANNGYERNNSKYDNYTTHCSVIGSNSLEIRRKKKTPSE